MQSFLVGLSVAAGGALHESFTRHPMRRQYDGVMLRPTFKPLLLLVLAISLVAGLSQAVIASNTMVLQMTVMTAATGMAGMDCEQKLPGKPCDIAATRCAACTTPSIDMPRLSDASFGIGEVGMGEPAIVASTPGIDSGPQLPPPRNAYIA